MNNKVLYEYACTGCETGILAGEPGLRTCFDPGTRFGAIHLLCKHYHRIFFAALLLTGILAS
jgi:hypothetical protein